MEESEDACPPLEIFLGLRALAFPFHSLIYALLVLCGYWGPLASSTAPQLRVAPGPGH